MTHKKKARSSGVRFCIAWVVVFLATGWLTALWAAQESPGSASSTNRRLGRGVNIMGYDPIWRSMDQARFKARYFGMIKEAGFSTVRVNLHAFRHMDPDNDYALRDSWWQVLDWAVEHALKADLMVILDLHEFGAMGNDPEGNKHRFLAFWRQVSERLQNAPNNVLFEILNEPSRKLDAEMWNRYFREALAIIRRTNPQRMVVIGPPRYNSIGGLRELDLPADDRNIIVTVHYYSPMEFTHQGAPWSSHKDKIGVEWKGTEEEKFSIDRDLAFANAWAQENNRTILLGEFGVYDEAAMESRARYLNSVTRSIEKLGWSWAYWQFDSDFILYDIDKEKWVEPVLSALIPK